MIEEKFNVVDIYELEDLLERMERSKHDWWVYDSEITTIKRVIEFLRENIID